MAILCSWQANHISLLNTDAFQILLGVTDTISFDCKG